MPKYDVRCNNCGMIYEISHKISEPHPSCKECGGGMDTIFPMGTKLTNTQFKGSGWADDGKGGTK